MLQVEALGQKDNPQVADILYVGWLDYHPVMKHQLEASFVQIIEDLNRFRIPNLLLDSSFRKHHPSEKDLKEIYTVLLGGLAHTGLEKMARVSHRQIGKDEMFRHDIYEIRNELQVDFNFRNFDNTPDALNWLQTDEWLFGNTFPQFVIG